MIASLECQQTLFREFLKCSFLLVGTPKLLDDLVLIRILLLQGLAAVFNISLGIVSWWTSKESERYNRLIQLRVFVFCVNILHAYITGPIIYQNDDTPMLAPGTLISDIPQDIIHQESQETFNQDCTSRLLVKSVL